MYSLYRGKYSKLKLAGATMGRGKEAAKSSGRDKPMWIAIHKSMEVTLALCSYVYFKLAKMLCFSYNLLCFFFNKIGEQEGRTSYAYMWTEVAQTLYTHVSKGKNDKRNK
jgi:hypothetical protein